MNQMNLAEVYHKTDLLNHNEKCTGMTSLNTYGIDEEPSVLPRLGDWYQAVIPSFISEMPTYNDVKTDFNFYTSEGLAIPIMWAHRPQHVAGHVGHPQKNNLNGYQTVPHGTTCKDEISDSQVEHGKQSASEGYVPLPDSSKDPWSDSESQSFLLGLYIFGKDLVLVQRFVGSKDISDVLSFYYGRFYRSNAQCRWVECRKNKSRRCIFGHHIFTGRRQQKLLLRLLPSISKEVQEILFEVTKAFNEGAASLEEFIFTLKAIVGPKALVEAVAIDKGKQDLTALVPDAIRTNHVVSTHSKIPAGREWSYLTSEEIIKFLTGDFRLSKAKSDDLFWEAVWPRLLARGWHSEQPKDINKNCLVFLIPGIKKFSRRKLTLGKHYFFSVSDVLNKVASEPRLLELEVQESNVLNKVALEPRLQELEVEDSEKRDGISNKKPSYLHPRLLNCNSDLVKFTAVDTSLSNSDSITEESNAGDTLFPSQCESNQSLSDNNKKVLMTTLSRNGNDLDKRRRLNSRKYVRIGSRSFCAKEKEHFQMESLKTNKETAGENKKPSEEIKTQPLTLVDKNLHPQDLESKGTDIVLSDGKNPSLNSRRQGTRNRPPTVKALEAVACGLLGVQKEKGMKISHRARKNVKSLMHVSNASTHSNPNPSLMVPSFREETRELLGVL